MAFDVRLQSEISAPIIVLGRVESADSVGRPRRSFGDPRIMVQLTRIRLQIEQVLKGPLGGDRLNFYYYTYSLENDRDLGVPRFRPIPGDRRIFFLQGFDGGYRSVGDVTDYTLAVKSGYHRRDFCGGKPIGCCIAETLLTPGEGYDPRRFAPTVGQTAAVAKVLCSQDRALELVQELERSPDALISRAATEVLRPWRTYQQFP
jgi:hypothetical protein